MTTMTSPLLVIRGWEQFQHDVLQHRETNGDILWAFVYEGYTPKQGYMSITIMLMLPACVPRPDGELSATHNRTGQSMPIVEAWNVVCVCLQIYTWRVQTTGISNSGLVTH
jgi:hypothetical protein